MSAPPSSVFHLDAFLYDEADEDRLVEEGKISRAVCTKCGSKELVPTSECPSNDLKYLDAFLPHSMCTIYVLYIRICTYVFIESTTLGVEY